MMKRLAFVAGFGIGFVVGSASGRKSFESLRDTALSTWNDPKVQQKVGEGAEWVKSEVPVVGEKLSDSAKKASGSAQQGAAAAKDKARQGAAAAQDKAQGGNAQGRPGGGDQDLPEPVTTEKDTAMKPAHPEPDPEDMDK